jgi:two-component system, cell cycle sensor histidine kinase and response regulator CckA
MDSNEALRRLASALPDDASREALECVARELREARERGATVTEAIRALLRSQETYPLVFSHERDPMSLFEVATGRILEVNERWVALYGYTRSEALTMRVTDVSSEPAQTHSAIALARTGGAGQIALRWHRKKDGTVFPVELTCGKLELAGREVMYAAMRDISERIRAEEALGRSESSFRTLIETMQDFVVVHRDGRLVYMNTAANAALGYAPGEMIGRPVIDLIHPDDHAIVIERIKRAETEGRTTALLEERLLRKDGTAVVVEVSGVRTEFDGQPSIIALARDVSARKRMEAQLVMADRLASIGRLAASVGHEINNPLAYVLGTISLMQRDLQATELPANLATTMAERLDVLREGAERMRDIVRELKTLARADDEVNIAVDVASVLDVCADMAAHEIRHRARLTKDYAPDLFVWGSEARLGQVFLNLLVNAGQAIPEGAAAHHEVRVTATRTGDTIAVEVRDTGTGVPSEHLEHIFEPFFTTKSPGTSSGLGLSISHHIVTSLGGSIEARCDKGPGTSLLVRLPAAEMPAPQPSPRPAPAAESPRGRVLVVDDEPAHARICAENLSGHEVILAGSGRQAIELLSLGEVFDAIVCDLLMGDGTGVDVHEYMREHRPGSERRIVFMTGGASTRAAQELLGRVGNVWLEKPFTERALRDAVRHVIIAEGR